MSSSMHSYDGTTDENGSAGRPFGVIATLWFVVFTLALYTAPELRNWVEGDDVAGPDSAVAGLAVGMVSAGEALGVPHIRDVFESIRTGLNAEHIVLKRPAAEASPIVLAETVTVPETQTPKAPSTPSNAGDSVKAREANPPSATDALSSKSAQVQQTKKSRILIVGASSIQHALGKELEAVLKAETGATIKRFGKAATGLSRPDVLDWPKKLKGLVDAFKPDLVIANFGGNDGQNLPLPNNDRAVYGTKKWNKIYTQRIQDFIAIATKNGADFINLGMPVMRSARFSRKMKKLNGITELATKAVGGVYIETWDLAADEKGAYRKTVVIKGKKRLMRQADGIHYTRYGGRYVAGRLLSRLGQHFPLKEKTAVPSTAP